jgi:peptide/nickel transport system permease protein
VRAYLLRRLWQSAVTLVGVSILVFVILRVIPGDPAKMLLPEGAPQAAVEALNRHLGLREPLWIQYGLFLRSVVQGDFGQSFQYRSPALRVVIERVPATIQLTLTAMALTVWPACRWEFWLPCASAPAGITPAPYSRCSVSRCRTSGSASCWYCCSA